MIVSLLQDFLVEELKNLFNNFTLKNTKEHTVPLNIYPQYLPAKKNEDDENHFPYVLVRILEGEEKDEHSQTSCRIVFVIGVYDWDENYQGYKDVLNIIEKIRQHLYKKRIFNRQFIVEYPFQWAVNEEEAYPYFFGGIETNWSIAKPMREEEEE